MSIDFFDELDRLKTFLLTALLLPIKHFLTGKFSDTERGLVAGLAIAFIAIIADRLITLSA